MLSIQDIIDFVQREDVTDVEFYDFSDINCSVLSWTQDEKHFVAIIFTFPEYKKKTKMEVTYWGTSYGVGKYHREISASYTNFVSRMKEYFNKKE